MGLRVRLGNARALWFGYCFSLALLLAKRRQANAIVVVAVTVLSIVAFIYDNAASSHSHAQIRIWVSGENANNHICYFTWWWYHPSY